MTSSPRSPQNHLIELLPSQAQQRLLKLCEPVELQLSEVLSEEGEPSAEIYFPVRGFISLIAAVDGHPGLEVGMVGREGMLGTQFALGQSRSPVRAVVQGAGSAWRVSAQRFRQELLDNPPLRRCLERYIYVSMNQLSASTACLRFHQITPRLARWLLMSQDRAHADGFHLTHEFLAYMLGVRRVGVTLAAGKLQRAGVISYRRGEIRVLERAALEACACSCYAQDCSRYAALL